jgi:cation transport regulator
MPYSSNTDLPSSVKSHLPEHAQSIYRKAFNSALEQYKEEETACKVAWAAVKHEYEKSSNGMWVKK